MNEIYKYKVNLDSELKLSSYSNLLDKFENWKEFNRDIKLTNLLEGKKVKFDIEITSPKWTTPGSLYGGIVESDDTLSDLSNLMNKASFIINKLSFIVFDYNVIELEIEIDILNTEVGKVLKSFLECGINMEISQHVKDDDVRFFYIKKTS